MLEETAFHRLADSTLDTLMARLEGADADGALEMESAGGIVTIALPSGKQFVVSKHAPTRQIWLSSPVSGGLHFSHAAEGWKLPDGRELEALLTAELRASGVPL